ncbi:hypothetical protein [Nocardia sp. NPDC004123]
MTAEGFAEAQDSNPAADFRTVPKAGHMVCWDNLTAALAVVRQVLTTDVERTAQARSHL